MPEVTYRYFQDPEEQTRLAAELEPYLRLLPSWCGRVIVNRFVVMEGDDNFAATLSVNMNPAYRFCELSVYGPFFMQPKSGRKQSILHELIHVMTGDPLEWVKEHVLSYVKAHNSDLGVYLENEFRNKVEAMTESLAYTLARELGEEIPHHGHQEEHQAQ